MSEKVSNQETDGEVMAATNTKTYSGRIVGSNSDGVLLNNCLEARILFLDKDTGDVREYVHTSSLGAKSDLHFWVERDSPLSGFIEHISRMPLLQFEVIDSQAKKIRSMQASVDECRDYARDLFGDEVYSRTLLDIIKDLGGKLVSAKTTINEVRSALRDSGHRADGDLYELVHRLACGAKVARADAGCSDQKSATPSMETRMELAEMKIAMLEKAILPKPWK